MLKADGYWRQVAGAVRARALVVHIYLLSLEPPVHLATVLQRPGGVKKRRALEQAAAPLQVFPAGAAV